ncbi:hypothetical protein NC651_016466 [Populus alba x Populus x berolinensis]|nr:hypothetical protein NC651_016466 [Populus alba x Populus x berolinensis]
MTPLWEGIKEFVEHGHGICKLGFITLDRDELINELKRSLEQANTIGKNNTYWAIGKESLSHKALYKLSFRRHEPYRITQKVGEVACKSELREQAYIHPVSYVSQLKHRRGDSQVRRISVLPIMNQDW